MLRAVLGDAKLTYQCGCRGRRTADSRSGHAGEPATPFSWPKALAGCLKLGVLLGWKGDGHTAYMRGSSCVGSAVDKYLISRVNRCNGTVCP